MIRSSDSRVRSSDGGAFWLNEISGSSFGEGKRDGPPQIIFQSICYPIGKIMSSLANWEV